MIEIGHFVPADYDEVMALWGNTEGLTLREADSCEAITHYLACKSRPQPPVALTSPLRFVSQDESRMAGFPLSASAPERSPPCLQHLTPIQ